MTNTSDLFDATPLPPKLFDGRGEKWEGWIEKFLEYGWARKRLPAGDFWFQSCDKKVVGVEVKTVGDLLSRMGDARREFAQMIDSVDIPLFLVYGKWGRMNNDVLLTNSRRKITWANVWNMLQTFQNSGLRVEVALSREHAFTRINQLYSYYQDPDHTANLVARRCSSDRRVASLMPIPGISEKLGKALLGHFGSVARVAVAKEETLREVPLIGEKKAQMIYRYFHQQEPFH